MAKKLPTLEDILGNEEISDELAADLPTTDNVGFTHLPVLILLDTSGSTFFHLWEIKQAAINFAKQLRPQDRVLIVTFDRRGRRRCRSVEPGHPLTLQRIEHRDGSGTILIHPNGAERERRAELVLAGVPSPREVDRLIRRTFNPPGATAGTV